MAISPSLRNTMASFEGQVFSIKATGKIHAKPGQAESNLLLLATAATKRLITSVWLVNLRPSL